MQNTPRNGWGPFLKCKAKLNYLWPCPNTLILYNTLHPGSGGQIMSFLWHIISHNPLLMIIHFVIVIKMFIEHEFYIKIVKYAFLDQCWAVLKCWSSSQLGFSPVFIRRTNWHFYTRKSNWKSTSVLPWMRSSGYENWFKFYFIFKFFLRIEHVLSWNSDSVLRVFVSFIGSSCSSSHKGLLLLAPLDLLLTWGCYFYHVVITLFPLLFFFSCCYYSSHMVLPFSLPFSCDKVI